MIIGAAGAVVGQVTKVEVHPNGQFIRLAHVDLGNSAPPVKIVYGGDLKLEVDDLVPAAPPGVRVTVLDPERTTIREKKMRARNYRGQRSHGMLCSLDELGWLYGGPDEVALLQKLKPGFNLDLIRQQDRPEYVVGWERAQKIARGAQPTQVDGPIRPHDHEGVTLYDVWSPTTSTSRCSSTYGVGFIPARGS